MKAPFKFNQEQKSAIRRIVQDYQLVLRYGTERQFISQLEEGVRHAIAYRDSASPRPTASEIRRRLRQFAGGLERSLSRLDAGAMEALRTSETQDVKPLLGEHDRLQALEILLAGVTELEQKARRAADVYKAPPQNSSELLIELIRRNFERFFGHRAGRSVRFDTKTARHYESGAFFDLVQTVARAGGIEAPSADSLRGVLRYRDDRERKPEPRGLVTRVRPAGTGRD